MHDSSVRHAISVISPRERRGGTGSNALVQGFSCIFECATSRGHRGSVNEEGDFNDLREELRLVRRKLDRLVSDRLSHWLSLEEEHSYHELSRREVELIWELAVVDLSDRALEDRDERDDSRYSRGSDDRDESRDSGRGAHGTGSSSSWEQHFDTL